MGDKLLITLPLCRKRKHSNNSVVSGEQQVHAQGRLFAVCTNINIGRSVCPLAVVVFCNSSLRFPVFSMTVFRAKKTYFGVQQQARIKQYY